LEMSAQEQIGAELMSVWHNNWVHSWESVPCPLPAV